jgi:hypothetical protein
MKLGRLLISAGIATSLVGAPVVAQAAAVQQARLGSEVEGEQLRGGFVIPLIALIAIILGILAATGGDDDDDLPHSP